MGLDPQRPEAVDQRPGSEHNRNWLEPVCWNVFDPAQHRKLGPTQNGRVSHDADAWDTAPADGPSVTHLSRTVA